MTAMEAVLEQIRQSPEFKSHVEALQQTLRREEEARARFRASLDEDVRAEFINGKVVIQMPARLAHFQTLGRVFKLLDTFVTLRKLGTAAQEQALVSFPRNDYGPDICFWKKARARNFAPNQTVFPPPDFVCEILSPGTADRDRGVKFADFQRYGVTEYWIIDADARAIEQYVPRGRRYELVGRFTEGVVRSRAIRGFRLPVLAAFDDAANLANLAALKALVAP